MIGEAKFSIPDIQTKSVAAELVNYMSSIFSYITPKLSFKGVLGFVKHFWAIFIIYGWRCEFRSRKLINSSHICQSYNYQAAHYYTQLDVDINKAQNFITFSKFGHCSRSGPVETCSDQTCIKILILLFVDYMIYLGVQL